MTVIFGTVASAKAKSSFAPCLMMPPYSCCVPGRKPGTSSNVISGMLKASQKRTKRAPFTEALISSVPARQAGWLATTPTLRPLSRAKLTQLLFTHCTETADKSPCSTYAHAARYLSDLEVDSAG